MSNFTDACREGDLEKVIALLKTPNRDLTIEIGAQMACHNGHLNVVRHLLTSEDLNENLRCDINAPYLIQRAAQNNQMAILEFLLTSPELPIHPTLKNADFIWAVMNGHDNVALYLLNQENQFFNFEETGCNLQWAMENNKHELVYAMTRVLLKNAPDICPPLSDLSFYILQYSPEKFNALIEEFGLEYSPEFSITPLL